MTAILMQWAVASVALVVGVLFTCAPIIMDGVTVDDNGEVKDANE